MIADEIPVNRVFRRSDARQLDEAVVGRLADSIRVVGIMNPLRVRPVRRMVDGVESDAFEVTAGSHRLKAALKAGLETVPCFIVSDDDLHAELAMIDENLMRAELGPADRAAQTARRKAIYEELHPETKHGAIGGGHDQSRQLGDSADRFTSSTAAATGKSERTVQRDAERGEKVSDEALSLVRGTELDTGTYLDKLKKVEPSEQVPTVQRALAGVARREAKVREEQFEARHKAKLESDIKDRAANEIAELLAEHMPADFWDCIKANLAVTDTKRILSALSNRIGHSLAPYEAA